MTKNNSSPPDFLIENKYAPKFNIEAWDQLNDDDRNSIYMFTKELSIERKNKHKWDTRLTTTLKNTLNIAKNHLLNFKHNGQFKNLELNFQNDAEKAKRILEKLPRTDRTIYAKEPWNFIPDNEDYSSMVLYNTAGTTGNPIQVPSHPLAIGKYCSFIQEVLKCYEIDVNFSNNHLGIALIGFQKNSVTFPTVMSILNNSGFVKLDLNKVQWNDEFDSCYYLSILSPQILTGDPFAFKKLAELYEKAMKMDPKLKPIVPKAMIPTAVALTPSLKDYLEDFFKCPVIDWYSLTETGPIGYVCKENNGYHLLPTDLFIEVLDVDGTPVQYGEKGEIVVSGGRNPYFPLIRYRTGDWGRLDTSPCLCGDPMPRIVDLQGRDPVLFQTPTMAVNNADIVMVMYNYPVANFTFHQNKDLSCILRFNTVSGKNPHHYVEVINNNLVKLLGTEISLKVIADENMSNSPEEKKDVAFTTDVPFFYD